jgi:spermidine synthase
MKNLIPKTLYKGFSHHSNSSLVVLESGNRRTMGAGYINYSLWSSDEDDLFEDRYWGQLIKSLKIKDEKLKIDSVLIMGLAGGTLAYLVDRYFAPQKITGIEIDPEIIRLGREYFYLDQLSNLKIVQADVVNWLDGKLGQNHPETYDLILMDLFQLGETPASCDTPEFFQRSIQLLRAGGVLALNKIFQRGDSNDKIKAYIESRFDDYFRKVVFDRYQRPLKLDNVLIYGIEKLKVKSDK